MIRGVERLGSYPGLADDDDYRRLQEDLDRIAPAVSNLAWGHKYLSLLSPRSSTTTTTPTTSGSTSSRCSRCRPEGTGRYLCAGRYVAAAHELGIPINHLTTILNSHNRQPARLLAGRHDRRASSRGTAGR